MEALNPFVHFAFGNVLNFEDSLRVRRVGRESADTFLGDVESLTYIFPFLNFQNFWRVCEELVGRLLRPD